MSYQQERRFVLDLLEGGRINPAQATQLLDLLASQPAPGMFRPSLHRDANMVYVEIDADQDTLQQVLETLSESLRPVIQN